jgi:PPK2 family polyphosphate:nucleotide phosphotransferase
MTTVRDLLRYDGRRLADHDPAAHPGVADKAQARRAWVRGAEKLGGLQERLYAEGSRSLVLVLQGMDTSGKGGTIEHVIGAVNPQGCRITGFKKPTPEELRHHFLWRIKRALPAPGQLGVFDRSHYEDVVVVRVHDLAPWEGRYDEIVRWERELVAAGTTLVKCLLRISYDGQRERLLARLGDPTKHWKFREADIDERQHWHEYDAAYDDALARCHTDEAPWYVVPSDRKWYRNWAVGRLLIETLTEMDPRYPDPGLDVPRLEARLAPPG